MQSGILSCCSPGFFCFFYLRVPKAPFSWNFSHWVVVICPNVAGPPGGTTALTNDLEARPHILGRVEGKPTPATVSMKGTPRGPCGKAEESLASHTAKREIQSSALKTHLPYKALLNPWWWGGGGGGMGTNNMTSSHHRPPVPWWCSQQGIALSRPQKLQSWLKSISTTKSVLSQSCVQQQCPILEHLIKASTNRSWVLLRTIMQIILRKSCWLSDNAQASSLPDSVFVNRR